MLRLLAPLLFAAGPVWADAPVVRDAKVEKTGMTWRVSVTLAHPDTGWDHYADGWRVEDAAGAVLGTRVLAHPHVMEQPFTRSLSALSLPDGTRQIFIRARCNLDGWAEETFPLAVTPGG